MAKKPKPPVRLTPDLKAKFLEFYALTGLKIQSAIDAGTTCRTVNNYIHKDPEFATQVQEAYQKFVESLEQVAVSRAKGGSDRLLELLLKRHIPEYRDKYSVDQTTTHKGGVTVTHDLDVKQMSPAQREALRTLLTPDEKPMIDITPEAVNAAAE